MRISDWSSDVCSSDLVERTGRLVETSRFSLSRRIGAPVAGPLDEDWFASVASHYGPLEPIDSADTLALAEAEANVAVAEAGVRLARSQRIPDLTVSAGARRFEETGDTAALIGLSIPLRSEEHTSALQSLMRTS